MTRSFTILLTAALLATGTASARDAVGTPRAEAPLQGLRAHVAQELPLFGFRDTDVRRLSNVQVLHINAALHSGRSRNHISGVIAGTLRKGFLQRALEGVSK
ncbi:hypothetical protein [Jannaschia sp. M317]|uniref:hypothetical protein n=1 Tax=Jannaschia sp. M317 TaxID=2867011 RepID=UPI0021A4FA8A|nr:hypothetical protein [Jannaschia sp. M317]UWQ18566.1 hypothetical protein K3551_04535 [Jannaschia sp. M317]